MKLVQNESALTAVTQLIEYAFNKKQPIKADPLFLSRYQHATCFGHPSNEQVSSLVMSNHFFAKLYENTLPLAGIGYVASFPEARGSGSIATLMTELLHELTQKKVPLSLLAPFSQAFYRQFGYENVTSQKCYEFSSAAFEQFKSEKTGTILRGTWQDQTQQDLIKAMYEEQLASKTEVVTIARESWWWDRLDVYYPHRFNAICFDEENQACGYVIYRMEQDTFYVDELFYRNNFGLRKLLTFIKSHVSSFKRFIYAAPMAECLEACFEEQAEIKITIRPYMMGRIVDFKTVVESIPFKKAGTYYFTVTKDEQCPENVGTWQVVCGDTVKCQKVTNQTADLTGDIHGWTQLLLSEQTLEQLLFLAKLASQQPEKLQQLFPSGQHSFYDYF